MSDGRLNVIALISGGKDSFYSLLHCLHHGHRVVALANLHPPRHHADHASPQVQVIHPDQPGLSAESWPCADKEDLNSFMYQTVGHQVIPLYAAATGLKLYRRPITGSAVRHERDYQYTADAQSPQDETESMLELLRVVGSHHPEANALCSGAILSTYQRTRVESVALRLGLVPLAFLWKYPVLPAAFLSAPTDEAQLLRDMAAAGLDARIIKVASAGLDERHLWERVSSRPGVDRIKAALRKFGAAEGAALGEGGEFETLVVDGPSSLFKKRVLIAQQDRIVVPEGGGTNWLAIQSAQLEDKPEQDVNGHANLSVREPGLLDARFLQVSKSLAMAGCDDTEQDGFDTTTLIEPSQFSPVTSPDSFHWTVLADAQASASSVQDQTADVVRKVRILLSTNGLDPGQITSVVIILREISDFPRVNLEYGKLFERPNPPSRVTISSGNLLPEGCNIIAHVAIPVSATAAPRNGLHVQSRSYWAPANIGPYSQAVETAVTLKGEPTSVRAVLIAGQIPLIPASMVLPSPSESCSQEQIVLSLQHLWRIGIEMGVQCWVSTVAYLSRQETDATAKETAELAVRAWKLAHGSPADIEELDDGPDPWDLKYNPKYQSLDVSGAESNSSQDRLPDWSIFTSRQRDRPASCIPPAFVVEVESLPRQSLVEWHAHAGLKNIKQGSAELISLPSSAFPGDGSWRSWHLVVKTPGAALVYTTMAFHIKDSAPMGGCPGMTQESLVSAFEESLARLQPGVELSSNARPYLAYVDASRMGEAWSTRGAGDLGPLAVVPCRSLWCQSGMRLGLVALHKTVLYNG